MRKSHSLAVSVFSAALTISACSAGTIGAGGGATTVTKLVTITETAQVAAPSSTAAADAATPSPSGPTTTLSTDGVFVVGTDISPGTYKTAGPRNGPICSWARLNRLASITDADAIIKNGNEMGPGFVTIEPSDTAFATQLCLPWQKID